MLQVLGMQPYSLDQCQKVLDPLEVDVPHSEVFQNLASEMHAEQVKFSQYEKAMYLDRSNTLKFQGSAYYRETEQEKKHAVVRSPT